jgi:hypothetical protein
MRAWQLAAGAAAMMTTHVALAAPVSLVPVGLGGSADTGGVLGVTAQPGTRIAPNFRLRLGVSAPVAITGQRTIDPMKTRRIATMLDFYPDAESGLRLSAGMRMLSKRGRAAWSPYKASQPNALLYAPATAGKFPVRNNISQTAPTMTVGWTTRLSDTAVFGLEAGTIMEHGGTRRSSATIAQPRLKTAEWSRVDPVAQIAFAMKF